MKLVDDNVKSIGNNNSSIQDIIDWIAAHEKDGNILKLIVLMDHKDGEIDSMNFNVGFKDFSFMLVDELIGLHTDTGES